MNDEEKAEYEARERAEYEARERAEYEARERAEYEARERAEYEARERAARPKQINNIYRRNEHGETELQCPECGEWATADHIDNGVGMQRCGPYICNMCFWVEPEIDMSQSGRPNHADQA